MTQFTSITCLKSLYIYNQCASAILGSCLRRERSHCISATYICCECTTFLSHQDLKQTWSPWLKRWTLVILVDLRRTLLLCSFLAFEVILFIYLRKSASPQTSYSESRWVIARSSFSLFCTWRWTAKQHQMNVGQVWLADASRPQMSVSMYCMLFRCQLFRLFSQSGDIKGILLDKAAVVSWMSLPSVFGIAQRSSLRPLSLPPWSCLALFKSGDWIAQSSTASAFCRHLVVLQEKSQNSQGL